MYQFTKEELRMIRTAIETEIMRRERYISPFVNKVEKYKELEDKVLGLIYEMEWKENTDESI